MKLKKFRNKNNYQHQDNKHKYERNNLEDMSMHAHTHHQQSFWFTLIKISVLLSLAIYFVVINFTEPSGEIRWTWHYGIWLPITSYVVFWEGRGYFRLYKKLFKGIVDMDTLIGLAVHIIYLYSIIIMFMNLKSPMYSYEVMWEAPIVLIIITNYGHSIEEKLSKFAKEAYEKLRKLKNSKVNVLIKNKIKVVETKDVKLGSIILVKKGEIVALDGTIVAKKSVFNYANITGESKGVELEKDQEVISGAFNLGDSIKLKVTKTHENSTIGRIIEKIENASMVRPKVQKVADNVLKWFIPVVLMISFLTFLTWFIVGSLLTNGINLPWNEISNKTAIFNAIRAGVTVLAIACPCALGIATPLVISVSSTLSMKAGLLINNVNALEGINKIKYFAFDKTGTITTDQLIVAKIHGNKKLLGVAKRLENEIKHPIANAILSIEGKMAKVLQVKSLKDQGIIGLYQGKNVAIKAFSSNDKKFDINNTLIALYVENKPELIFELQNEIRPGVLKTINNIKSYGYTPIMITGDNKYVANHVAKQVGIEKVYSKIDPANKSTIIKNYQKKGGVVFVGDGFNDSIAMKQAKLSLAFATGSDITNSLADISIINNHFSSISLLIKIAKMNKNRIRISLTWALLFNIVTIPIAIILLVPPWAGAVIMSTSDILVVMTALLYKIKGTKIISKNQALNLKSS